MRDVLPSRAVGLCDERVIYLDGGIVGWASPTDCACRIVVGDAHPTRCFARC